MVLKVTKKRKQNIYLQIDLIQKTTPTIYDNILCI